MKKYEILMDKENTIEFEGRTLHRIKALKDFRDVKQGDVGGYIESESNLSQEGDCWIYDNAKSMDNSRMYGNSRMYDDSKMYNSSAMHEDSRMYDDSEMHGNSIMYGDSELNNKAKLYGKLTSKVDDFIEIQNPQGRLVTCVRKGDKVLYTVGCQTEITEEEFKWRIKNCDGGLEKNPHRRYYYKIINMAKEYFFEK